MKPRTRSQQAALNYFKENTTASRTSQKYQHGRDAILAPGCLRPRTRAKALIKAERRTRVVTSAKSVSRQELEMAILQFTTKYGSPDPALVHVNGREAPIEAARRLADTNDLTATHVSMLLELMKTCVGLWPAADVKNAKAWAARKLCKPEPDPRYRMTSLGWSIPLKVALAEPAEGEASINA